MARSCIRPTDPDRRKLLRALVHGAAVGVAGFGFFARRAAAEAPMRQALIRENQADEFGLTAGSASRAVPMPNPSLPTLSQATVQATERAILEYEAIVARGGWPELARLGCMRLWHASSERRRFAPAACGGRRSPR